MKQSKKNAFTLIELIAVLVIMAIIALIVTPLVMNIIRKARISADKRSIDAYGRSIELAIAGYLMDNGSFPTDINQLTIEYSGDEVVCSTTQINTDSSVYLAGCTVGGRSVENYTYGKEETTPTYAAYSVGDHVSYNNVTYYVIEDSDANTSTVKLLKENPLLKTEIDALNLSGITVTEYNSYGKVQYGSSVDYSTSTVKQVVDAWKNTAVATGDTASARLISFDEIHSLGYDDEPYDPCGGCGAILYKKTELVPKWLYIYLPDYWTMGSKSSSSIWNQCSDGTINGRDISDSWTIRPVLELNKSADITKLAS